MFSKVDREVFEIVYYGKYNSITVGKMSPVERKKVINLISEYKEVDDKSIAEILKVLRAGR